MAGATNLATAQKRYHAAKAKADALRGQREANIAYQERLADAERALYFSLLGEVDEGQEIPEVTAETTDE